MIDKKQRGVDDGVEHARHGDQLVALEVVLRAAVRRIEKCIHALLEAIDSLADKIAFSRKGLLHPFNAQKRVHHWPQIFRLKVIHEVEVESLADVHFELRKHRRELELVLDRGEGTFSALKRIHQRVEELARFECCVKLNIKLLLITNINEENCNLFNALLGSGTIEENYILV